jgi:hypothetical protein
MCNLALGFAGVVGMIVASIDEVAKDMGFTYSWVPVPFYAEDNIWVDPHIALYAPETYINGTDFYDLLVRLTIP